MAKSFKNINDALAYIKAQQVQAVQEIGREATDIIKEKTESNLYGNYSPDQYNRTKDMIRMIQILRSSSKDVLVGFKDIGGHTSWGSSNRHVFVAPILEEGGHTWERNGGRKSPTNIIKDSKEEIRDRAPEIYVRVMKSKGIKANRK